MRFGDGAIKPKFGIELRVSDEVGLCVRDDVVRAFSWRHRREGNGCEY